MKKLYFVLFISSIISGCAPTQHTVNSVTPSGNVVSTPTNVSKNPNCNELNTGDYCFKNTTKFKLTVRLNEDRNQDITIDPGQTQCFYDLKVGSFKYNIFDSRFEPDQFVYTAPGEAAPYKSKGQIYVELCKSLTFVIR